MCIPGIDVVASFAIAYIPVTLTVPSKHESGCNQPTKARAGTHVVSQQPVKLVDQRISLWCMRDAKMSQCPSVSELANPAPRRAALHAYAGEVS